MRTSLEIAVDKFTFRVATDRWYTADGMWILPTEPSDGTQLRLGVTDFLQQRSGDIAFLTVRPPGTAFQAGEDVAEIETVKVNIALPAPVTGTVIAVNAALDSTPEIVNQDPYGEGWLALIAVANWDTTRAALLTPEAYFALMQQQAESALAQS